LATLAAITATLSRPFTVFIVSSPCFLQLCGNSTAVNGFFVSFKFILHINFAVEHRANSLVYSPVNLCVRRRDGGLTGRPETVTNEGDGDRTSR
ncbi:MAG: hypothetical protein VXZ25_00785, partial [Pseudomonadota bacterium]|nr:hypothetical protein [Pseudomonadota bacterium]